MLSFQVIIHSMAFLEMIPGDVTYLSQIGEFSVGDLDLREIFGDFLLRLSRCIALVLSKTLVEMFTYFIRSKAVIVDIRWLCFLIFEANRCSKQVADVHCLLTVLLSHRLVHIRVLLNEEILVVISLNQLILCQSILACNVCAVIPVD